MKKNPKNNGKPWTPQDLQKMKDLVKHNTPTGLIAYELGRSESAVYSKASEEEISLKPTNKSPYGDHNKNKK